MRFPWSKNDVNTSKWLLQIITEWSPTDPVLKVQSVVKRNMWGESTILTHSKDYFARTDLSSTEALKTFKQWNGNLSSWLLYRNQIPWKTVAHKTVIVFVVCSTVIRTTSRRWNVFIIVEARQTDACQYGKCYTGMVILKQNENKHNL